MTEIVLIAAVPIGVEGDTPERLRLDAEFEARWVAWKSRGLVHERAVRRRLLVLAPAVVAAAAVAYFVLSR